MTDPRADGPATVLSTSDPGLLAVAQSLLEAAGIEYFVKGDNERIVPPFAGWAELQVAAADAAEARELLADLQAG
jgi:hypothetical protein